MRHNNSRDQHASAARICQRPLHALLLTMAGLMAACNERPKTGPVLHTTISSDGRMLATLMYAGTDAHLLRVRNLDTDTTWRHVTAPPWTQSIRFGLRGHELLLTHKTPGLPASDLLSRIDLDHPERGPQTIYSAPDLSFPVEVEPGKIMVRTHRPPPTAAAAISPGDFYWILVGPDQTAQPVGPQSMFPYAAPEIVGRGFFWTEDQIGLQQEDHPRLLRFALPGGDVPDISASHLEKNTFSIRCDRQARRCLRSYIANFGHSGPFVYDVEVILGEKRGPVVGVAGFGDPMSITPDGNAAIMSLALASGQPRHVVVMHFKPQQCEPVSVQHLYFDSR